jgi:hypothetical protein
VDFLGASQPGQLFGRHWRAGSSNKVQGQGKGKASLGLSNLVTKEEKEVFL